MGTAWCALTRAAPGYPIAGYREYRKRVPMLIPSLSNPGRLQEQIEKTTVS